MQMYTETFSVSFELVKLIDLCVFLNSCILEVCQTPGQGSGVVQTTASIPDPTNLARCMGIALSNSRSLLSLKPLTKLRGTHGNCVPCCDCDQSL